jgi:NAD-dependent dihydropyrimidine dehydrogenase PreA subunit
VNNSFAVITEPCVSVKDGACVEACPVECIYEGDDQFFIHPDECIDCGACFAICPTGAIFSADDVPLEWTGYIAKAKAHFAL